MAERRLLHNEDEFYRAWCKDSLYLDFGRITRKELSDKLRIKFGFFESTQSGVIRAIRANGNLFETAYREIGVDFWGDPGEVD